MVLRVTRRSTMTRVESRCPTSRQIRKRSTIAVQLFLSISSLLASHKPRLPITNSNPAQFWGQTRLLGFSLYAFFFTTGMAPLPRPSLDGLLKDLKKGKRVLFDFRTCNRLSRSEVTHRLCVPSPWCRGCEAGSSSASGRWRMEARMLP